MSQVDFYVLHSRVPQARERFVCRLTGQIFDTDKRIYIHTASLSQTALFDRLLWTYKDDSFLAHDVFEPGNNDNLFAPVCVGHVPDIYPPFDVLINLAPHIPDFADSFPRIVEAVNQEPHTLASGRERFRQYRERGHAMKTHDIQA